MIRFKDAAPGDKAAAQKAPAKARAAEVEGPAIEDAPAAKKVKKPGPLSKAGRAARAKAK